MNEKARPHLSDAESDANKLRLLRADQHAYYVREGPPAIRWNDVLPLPYLLAIWTGIAALVIFYKSPHLPKVLMLLFCVSLPLLVVALSRASSLYEEVHQHRLIEPLKISYVVSIASPEK